LSDQTCELCVLIISIEHSLVSEWNFCAELLVCQESVTKLFMFNVIGCRVWTVDSKQFCQQPYCA